MIYNPKSYRSTGKSGQMKHEMDNKWTTKINEGEGESSPTPTAKD